ncbi:NAD(P)H-dependent flavin oxidoreductase, partial [Thermodesulfobacteriota bacterium]
DFSEQCLQVGIEEQVPVAIVSQGSPEVYTEKLKKAGIKVIHVCATVRHALKAEQAGVDAVVASGTEGGGHSGFDQNTTFCIVPQVVDAVSIPVIAGGGVAGGRQLGAAVALGAHGVYVGTRFIATMECPAHETYKQALLAARDGDTFSIRHGQAARPGPGNRGFSAERRGSLRVLLNDRLRTVLAENSGAVTYESLARAQAPPGSGSGRSSSSSMVRGDDENAFFAAGQGAALIHEILPCKKLIEKMVLEAEKSFETGNRVFRG